MKKFVCLAAMASVLFACKKENLESTETLKTNGITAGGNVVGKIYASTKPSMTRLIEIDANGNPKANTNSYFSVEMLPSECTPRVPVIKFSAFGVTAEGLILTSVDDNKVYVSSTNPVNPGSVRNILDPITPVNISNPNVPVFFTQVTQLPAGSSSPDRIIEDVEAYTRPNPISFPRKWKIK